MARCGGYSLEVLLMETAELMIRKDRNYSELEIAARVGETLMKLTNQQEEEIARMKSLVDDRRQKVQRQKELCSSYIVLESIYEQPMNMLDREITYLRRQNEECSTKIRKYHTLLECSAYDQQSLSRVLQDLNATKNDRKPPESSSNHCILCVCAGNKESLFSQRYDQIYNQLAEKTALQVQLQKELDEAGVERKSIQEEIDIFTRQVDHLSSIVMKIEEGEEEEEEEKKSKYGRYSGDGKKGSQARDDNSVGKENKKKQDPHNLCSKCDESNPEIPELCRKTSGRFVNVVQSLML